MHELALCAGNGGLSLGLKLAVPTLRTVCYVEREAFAVEHLVRKGQAGALDEAPVWSDLSTFDGAPWRGVVDLVTAGFPCQPFSSAGARRGTDDERWLWPDIARVLREVRPGLVLLENVPDLVRRGLADVLASLAEIGLAAEWDVFSAGGVGAPHLRRRVFVLACDTDSDGKPAFALDDEVARLSRTLADPARGRRRTREQDRRTDAPHADGSGQQWAGSNAHEGRLGSEPEPWDPIEGRPEPVLRGVDDGPPDRVDRIRSIGNGVVPLVVAHAFRTLAARLGGGALT